MIIKASVFKAIFILLVGGALVLVLFLRFRDSSSVEVDIPVSPYDGFVSINKTAIPVSIADTDKKRELGLSGTPSLTKGSGKLFIFQHPGEYGFWMKDMKYDLDLVWIDAAFRIVDVTKGVTPASYPNVFYAKEPVLFVLEVNSGESELLKLTPGTIVSITKNE